MKEIGTKQMLDYISNAKDVPYLKMAEILGISRQHLNSKVRFGRVNFLEICRICDYFGLNISLFDTKHRDYTDFKLDKFLTTDSTMRYDDVERFLNGMGIEIVLKDGISGRVVDRNVGGYGRRVRAWIDGVDYDTHNASAVSTGLNTASYKYGGTEKYNVPEPKELYRDSEGRWFYAVYGKTKDYIKPITDDTAKKFIERYGRIDK